MDWANPYLLFWLLPAAGLVWLTARQTLHPMPSSRRRALLVVRIVCILLVLLALAAPAWELETEEETVVFVLDHSKSLGAEGMQAAADRVNALLDELPGDTRVGIVSAGATTKVLRPVGSDHDAVTPDPKLGDADGSETDLAGAVALASGLFPPGTARRLVIVSDGLETRGDVAEAAREAALQGIVIDAVPVHGPSRPDARVVRVRSSRARSHEGASIALSAEVESSTDGKARLRLFENGVEVESRDIELKGGEPKREVFQRTPEERNLYRYLVRIEDFPGDAIAENNEAMSLVEVRGRPLPPVDRGRTGRSPLPDRRHGKEGIRLHLRPPEAFPRVSRSSRPTTASCSRTCRPSSWPIAR